MSAHSMTEQELQEYFNTLIKKENNLLLFKKNGNEIYVLGTIHHYHLIESSDYSLAQVQSVIETVKPDILLIEARPETLEIYGTVDGPFEMIFARSYAGEHGIPVKGIDWWRPVKNKEAMNDLDLERDGRMFENIVSASAGHCKALVLCGAEHRGRMPERFIRNGHIQVRIDNILNYYNSVCAPFRYPKGVAEEYNRKCSYFQTGFLEEVERNISQGDELYEYFTEMDAAKNQRVIIEMLAEHRLYK